MTNPREGAGGGGGGGGGSVTKKNLKREFDSAQEQEANTNDPADDDANHTNLLPTHNHTFLHNSNTHAPVYHAHTTQQAWSVILGVAAALDFAGGILPVLLFPTRNPATIISILPASYLSSAAAWWHWCLPSYFHTEEAATEQVTLFQWWLETHHRSVGMLFSLLWFANAFIQAHRWRTRVMEQRDRDHLLQSSSSSSNTLVSNNETGSDVNVVATATAAADNENEIATISGACWEVYYFTIFIQLILLPMGFYLVAYHVMRVLLSDLKHFDFTDWDQQVTQDEYLTVPSPMHVTDYNDSADEYYEDDDNMALLLSTKSQCSLAYVLVHQLSLVVSRLVTTTARRNMVVYKRRMTRRVLSLAIRNPRWFRNVCSKCLRWLRWLRWVKYLAPLVGRCHKLRSNFKDVGRKYRQHVAAKKASIVRRQLWKKQSVQERQTAAALVIQSVWRRSQSQRMVEAYKIFQGNSKTIATIRIQRILRGRAARAKRRILQKRQELANLQQQRNERTQQKTQHGRHNNRTHHQLQCMSKEERKRMYILQDEIQTDVQLKLDRKLLLRPNTPFCITWKLLFCICVVLEITELALKPKFQAAPIANKRHTLPFFKRTSSTTTTPAPMDLGQFLEAKLVPQPMTEWIQCAPPPDFLKKESSRLSVAKQWLASTIRNNLLFISQPVEVMPKTTTNPWYCGGPYAKIQWVYIQLLRGLFRNTLGFMSLICFLDVFVNFLTGEYDTETGSLAPKPWFARWIVPGLVLQLLVNPRMQDMSDLCRTALQFASDVGPIRVYRWTMALFIPSLVSTFSFIEHHFWRQLVKTQHELLNQ